MRGAIAGNRTTGPPAYIAGALTLSYNGMDSIIRRADCLALSLSKTMHGSQLWGYPSRVYHSCG
jgi:hypothetical protein